MMDTDQLLRQAANGNEAAYGFLAQFTGLEHKIDDILDLRDKATPEFILRTFLECVLLFGANRFYREHQELLFPLALTALNAYATSVEHEKSDNPQTRLMADGLRFSGLRVVEMVAAICGGLEKMRDLSGTLCAQSWAAHHNEKGEAV